MRKNAIHTTFPDTLPELTGYVFLGFGFGIPELPFRRYSNPKNIHIHKEVLKSSEFRTSFLRKKPY